MAIEDTFWVESGSRDDYCVHAVFDTELDAELYVRAFPDCSWTRRTRSVLPVEARNGLHQWSVSFRGEEDEQVDHVRRQGAYDEEHAYCRRIRSLSAREAYCHTVVWAADEKGAIAEARKAAAIVPRLEPALVFYGPRSPGPAERELNMRLILERKYLQNAQRIGRAEAREQYRAARSAELKRKCKEEPEQQ